MMRKAFPPPCLSTQHVCAAHTPPACTLQYAPCLYNACLTCTAAFLGHLCRHLGHVETQCTAMWSSFLTTNTLETLVGAQALMRASTECCQSAFRERLSRTAPFSNSNSTRECASPAGQGLGGFFPDCACLFEFASPGICVVTRLRGR